MSFRGRLRIFFTIIVIVPMVAAALVLFKITADSERGKSDAGIATAMRMAFTLYADASRDSRAQLRRLARDGELNAALLSGDRRAAARRVRELARRPEIVAISLVGPDGRAIASVGKRGVATARAPLSRQGGGRLGTLAVSAADGRTLVGEARLRTGLEVAVAREDGVVASTVRGLDDVPRGSSDLEVGGVEYRSRREPLVRSADGVEDVVVLEDSTELNDAVTNSQVLIAAILLAFLVLALASSVFVGRALHSQIEAFLEAAQRLARGDFEHPVPTAGRDEFAALGREFNSMSDQLAAKIDEVERKREELQETIRRVGEAFATGLDRQGVLNLTMQTAVDACEADAGRALPLDRSVLKETHVGRADPAITKALEQAERQAFTVRPESAVELLDAGDGASMQRQRAPTQVEVDGAHAMALPLRARLGSRAFAQYVGVVSIARRSGPFRDTDVELLEYLAGQAVVSIENADLHETVQRQAVTDELTSLSNVRELHHSLERELERRRRFDSPLGFVLLDIDDFKKVNDLYGHQQGDEVLIEVARVLRDLSRDIDEPARYGGEELAVVLPQTDVEGAAQLAERMREAIADLRISRLDGEGELAVTASFGVASAPDTAGDKDSLIAAADAALYRAKRAGKNRVERAEPVAATS